MEHIASTLGKDPMEIRFANMSEPDKVALIPMIEELSKNADFKMRKNAVDAFNNVRKLLLIIVFYETN